MYACTTLQVVVQLRNLKSFTFCQNALRLVEFHINIVHYKAIEILAVRWLGTRLMHIFKEILQARKLGGLLGTTTKSVCLLFSTQIEYFTGRLGRSENEAGMLYGCFHD